MKNNFFRGLTFLGSVYFYGIVSIALLAIGETTIFWKLLIGAALMHVIATLIRLVYFKKRPKTKTYSNLIEKICNSAFPSMHSARAIYLFSIIASLSSSSIMTYPAAVLAASIAYSRVVLKEHDYTDVIAGMVLGLITLYLIGYVISFVMWWYSVYLL